MAREECTYCDRPATHTVREADTGAMFPACGANGCTTPPAPLAVNVPCLNCQVSGGLAACVVCEGAGHVAPVRQSAWLASGVLINPRCRWQRVGNIANLHSPAGFVGQILHLGPATYWARYRTGTSDTFNTPEAAEEFLYVLMDDQTGAAT